MILKIEIMIHISDKTAGGQSILNINILFIAPINLYPSINYLSVLLMFIYIYQSIYPALYISVLSILSI